MSRRIYSLETEYALMQDGIVGDASLGRLYDSIENALVARHATTVCDTVGPRHTSIRSGGLVELKEGLFLDTGARVYYDTGHVEWACPECDSAKDATIWDLAANCDLEQAACQASNAPGSEGRVIIVKNNLDYATGATYGCHENYSVLRRLADGRDALGSLPAALAAFLVTRTILCGAGRLGAAIEDPNNPVAFQISQRADFIHEVASRDTRDGRAILNERDEPLADAHRYRRLHLILGDSNLSPWSTWMKLGTTGLVLDALEQGLIQCAPLLESPVRTLQEISRDLECRKRFRLRNAAPATAVEIQRWYWQAAAALLQNVSPNDDQPLILEQWAQALDQIAANPALLGNRADWRLKYDFFGRVLLPRLRTTWEEAAAWGWVIAKTESLPAPPPTANAERWLATLLSRADLAALSEVMDSRGLDWLDYSRQRRSYFTLRAMDVRFHDLDRQNGLFWPRYGEQAISGITPDAIESARREPPRSTRAWIRGHIMRSSNRSHLESMDWDRIYLKNGTSIPLPDPFASHDPLVEQSFG